MARKRRAGGRWPATTGLLAGYCAAAAGTLVAVAAGGTRHPAIALAVLACVAAVVATRVTIPVAVACGGLAWLFYDGFIAGRYAYLGWHGAADGWRLAICVGAALCGTALAWLLRSGPGRRTGEAAAPATVVSLAQARERRSRLHADAS